MSYSSFSKTFAVAASMLVLSGCATVSCGTRECRLEESARTMLKSDDIGLKAAGARTLIGLHPEIADNSAEIRGALVPKSIECILGEAKIVNGKKVIPCLPKVPSPALN